MPGEWSLLSDDTWWVEIEMGRNYGGIELHPGREMFGVVIENGTVRIPFAGKAAAELAAREAKIRVVGEHPVVAGEVLSDPPAIQGVPDQKAMQRARRSLLEYTETHGWMSPAARQELGELRAADTGDDHDTAS